MCHPEARQVLEWQEQYYSPFCGSSQNGGEEEGKTKMAVYRSKHTGKIYKVAEWSGAHLGIIMVKDNKSAPERRDYNLGPFGSVEIAERLLKEKAELCGWEEINSD